MSATYWRMTSASVVSVLPLQLTSGDTWPHVPADTAATIRRTASASFASMRALQSKSPWTPASGASVAVGSGVGVVVGVGIGVNVVRALAVGVGVGCGEAVGVAAGVGVRGGGADVTCPQTLVHS